MYSDCETLMIEGDEIARLRTTERADYRESRCLCLSDQGRSGTKQDADPKEGCGTLQVTESCSMKSLSTRFDAS